MHPILKNKSLLIDMDGVIYRGAEPIPGADEFIRMLQREKVPFLFVTNNSDHPVASFLSKLRKMNIHITPENLFSSAQATARALTEQIGPRGCAYVIAGAGSFDAIRAAGWTVRDEEGKPYGAARLNAQEIQAVVVGEGYTLTALRMEQAILLCMDGVPLYATNPDTFIPGPGGVRLIGAGCLYAGIEVATGKKATVIGKPELLMYRYALEKIKATPETSIMIGDRLDTDISGAKKLGMTGILVLSGATTAAMVPGYDPQPDLVLPSVQALID